MAKKKGLKKEKKHLVFDEKERTYVNIFDHIKKIRNDNYIDVYIFVQMVFNNLSVIASN